MSRSALTKGLFNDNNSCYVNALLQVLARCPVIKEWTQSYSHAIKDGNPNDCIKCILRETLVHMLQPPWEVSFIPQKFLDWIRKMDKRFKEGLQGDPHELLDFLIKETKMEFFNHIELETIVCNGKDGHVIQEASVRTPPGVGIQVGMGLIEHTTGFTDVGLLRQYSHEISPDGCLHCSGRKCFHRTLLSAPSVLLLKLDRFTMLEGQSWLKNVAPCAVQNVLTLTLSDNVRFNYKFIAAIEHEGWTPVTGHYVAKAYENGRWLSFSDNLVEGAGMNTGNVYVLFYGIIDNETVEDTQQPVQVESGNGMEFNEGTIPNDLIENKKEWREKYSVRTHSEWLTKCRLLLICMPKTNEKDTFRQQYETCLSNDQNIYYTITFTHSSFLRRIRTNPSIKARYDIWCQKISSKFGTEDVHGWLAEAYAIYFIYNQLPRQNPSLVFFYDLHENGLVTRVIVSNWTKIKPSVTMSIRRVLLDNKLFCLESCTNNCTGKGNYHFSLSQMQKMEDLDENTDELREAEEVFNGMSSHRGTHPLEYMMRPIIFNANDNVEEQVVKHVDKINIAVDERYTIYMLMVVNHSEPHTPEDLFRLWTGNDAEFAVYVGMTKYGRFREDHLISDTHIRKTAVSRVLKQNSVIYLVTSKECSSYQDAALGEAKLIQLFKQHEMEAIKTNSKLRFTLLNKNSSAIPLHEAFDYRLELDNFVGKGKLPFRFINEPYADVENNDSILQRHLVHEVIRGTMRGSFFRSSRKKKRRIIKTKIIVRKEKSSLVEGRGKQKLVCDVCNLECKTRCEFHSHRLTHAEVKRYNCQICSKILLSRRGFNGHMQAHKNANKFKCRFCPKRCSRVDALKSHEATHTKKKKYMCNCCTNGFMNRLSFNKHKLLHRKSGIYFCVLCSAGFSNYDALSEHALQHKDKIILCRICSKVFLDRKKFKTHTRNHKEAKLFKCRFCPSRFNRVESLRFHEDSHIRKKSLVCPLCKKEFKSKSGLMNHRLAHENKRTYVCDICSLGFNAYGTLRNHKLRHKDKEYICSLCNKILKSERGLAQHVKSHTTKIECKCPFCSKIFHSVSGLHDHVQTHNKTKRYTCSVCQKEFNNRSALFQHKVNHKSKTKTCEICNKGFRSDAQLNKHMQTHQDGREFLCELCGDLFKTNVHLRTHMSVHKVIKEFHCGICQASFTTKGSLERHMNKHSNIKKFKCDVCEESFYRQDYLVRHKRVVHKTDEVSKNSI